ncbi:MAG: anhydro-N-acetylmuramic acid kinase [Gammaproteobacteria bacterium]|nr:anhydro-N-acetylmuramic acid kinase [Gammaproteobacteria bacterium]MDH4255772.1 anhydro-N-acetylmuramic acid kinase [Gammaproteobacteria bacterium]MDH5311651.1 anhydro-N-acetylmuramic acid kinase [Gammaproteobacteria bacterium]
MAVSASPDALYIGLMSGTSMDGIDAALFRFGNRQCMTLATHSHPYPRILQERLRSAAAQPETLSVDTIGFLDQWVGESFRDATLELLANSGQNPNKVAAIGSHGQTIRHRPDADRPFTMQIGDPNLIANGTGITTVADFRRRDMAAGGQGAPLAPAFHAWLFGQTARQRVVLNIGGFANITALPGPDGEATGFDTGPGNALMDAWTRRNLARDYDDRGAWAATGSENPVLLKRLLDDPYFAAAPPKSTGLEYFNLAWLEGHLGEIEADPADVQATLLALTALSIRDSIARWAPGAAEIIVCGGGAHNAALLARLARELAPARVGSTAEHGLDPDWVEAAAFAWLARQTLLGLPGNLPAVTGAQSSEILGGIYLRTG